MNLIKQTSWRRISQSEIRNSATAESEGGAGIHFPHTPFSSRPARAFSLACEARHQFRSKKVRAFSNKGHTFAPLIVRAEGLESYRFGTVFASCSSASGGLRAICSNFSSPSRKQSSLLPSAHIRSAHCVSILPSSHLFPKSLTMCHARSAW